jgi:type I restriction enzyme S subunit
MAPMILQAVFLQLFGDPTSNPRKWKWMKLNQVGTIARGKSKHRPRNAPELLGGEYPFIQTGDIANCRGYIRNYSQTYSELGLKQSKIWAEGTLCITIAANIAATGILTFDACFPDSVVGFTPNKNVRTEYVQYWLSFLQKNLEVNAPKSAQRNINLKILSELDIPVPPIELQNRFQAVVERARRLEEKQKLSSEEIENLFDSLMSKAFRGELLH